MTPEQFDAVEQVFDRACHLPIDEQAAFVDVECAADAEVAAAVMSLLRADARTGIDLAPPAPPTAGQPTCIGGYRIVRQIGVGGMGVVYEAEQERPRRTVALKLLASGVVSEERRRRFELESQVLGLLQHPAIAQVFEAGIDDSGVGPVPYFAMELVRGESLARHADLNDLRTRERLELMARVCDGVHHAHVRGVIHRDLKPANILVDGSGCPKILDFGVARATEADLQVSTLRTDVGQVVGTVPYMSPEQAGGDGERIGATSDVYALGVICYELLAGRLPYDADRPQLMEALRVVRETEPTSLSSVDRTLRGDVETIVSKALAKEPERRYASAEDFAQDIRRYLADVPIHARPTTVGYQLRKFARRNRALVGGIVSVFVVLVVGLIGTGIGLLKAQDEAERANASAAFFRSILEGVDPNFAQGEDTTLLLRILENTAARIETELRGIPAVEADIRLAMCSAYFGIAEYEQALQQARRGYALFANVYGPDHELAIDAMRWIGVALDFKDDWAAAHEQLESTLTLARSALGESHPQTLSVASALGVSYHRDARYNDAAVLLESTLALQRSLLGDGNPATLRTRRMLGVVRLGQRRFDEGLELLEECLEVNLATRGQKHPETIRALGALGGAYGELGRYGDAVPLLEAAVEQLIEVTNDEHAEVLASRTALGRYLREMGRLDDAATQQEFVQQAYSRKLDSDDPRLLRSTHDLALIYRLQGRIDEAEPLARRASEKRAELYGEEYEGTIASRMNLAVVLEKQGQIGEARRIREELLEISERVQGADHGMTLTIKSDLAFSLDQQGDSKGALRLQSEVVDVRLRVLGEDDPETLDGIYDRGKFQLRLGRFREAVDSFTFMLPRWRTTFGLRHGRSTAGAHQLWRSLDGLEDLAPVLESVRLLVTHVEADPPSDPLRIALARALWAEALLDSGQLETARAPGEAAAASLRRTWESETVAGKRAVCARALARYFRAIGQEAEAAVWQARRDD